MNEQAKPAEKRSSMTTPDEATWIDEYFWAGYLMFLIEHGDVTLETPRAEVEGIRREFMAGLHDESEVR